MIQATDLNGDVAARFDAADLQTVAQKVDENVSDVESLNSKADTLEDQLGGVSFELDENGKPRISYQNGEETKTIKFSGGELKSETIGSWSGSGSEIDGTKYGRTSITVSQELMDKNPIFFPITTSTYGEKNGHTGQPSVSVDGLTVTVSVPMTNPGAGRGRSVSVSGYCVAVYID